MEHSSSFSICCKISRNILWHTSWIMYLDSKGVLPLLHWLEGVAEENEISARAENLLNMLADQDGKREGFLYEKILHLCNSTQDKMRQHALRRQEELLEVHYILMLLKDDLYCIYSFLTISQHCELESMPECIMFLFFLTRLRYVLLNIRGS